MKIKLVVVNGYPGSGKTTFETLCKAIMGPYCRSRSTIDKVKSLAMRAGWDGKKTPEARKLLSDLKDLLTQFNDMPFKDIVSHLGYFEHELAQYGVESENALFFVDSREPEEIARFKKELDAITLLIRRPGDDIDQSNHADANVENFEYDYIIENAGSIADLELVAQNFLKTIFGEEEENG